MASSRAAKFSTARRLASGRADLAPPCKSSVNTIAEIANNSIEFLAQ
jgi:hypothetical protein